MKKLIILAAIILAANCTAQAEVGDLVFSPLQIPAKPPMPEAKLDGAQRYLDSCPKSSYDTYGNLNGYAPINPNLGSRIYNPYGGYANIYRPVFY